MEKSERYECCKTCVCNTCENTPYCKRDCDYCNEGSAYKDTCQHCQERKNK